MIEQPRRIAGLLLEPTYGYGDTSPKRPSLPEVWREWIDSVGFWRDPSRRIIAFYAGYHFTTLIVFLVFFARHFSLGSVLAVFGIATWIATVYNTVWYHRYCTHRAFRFRSIWFARMFLWANPVCFREESYVIPHRVHHAKSDQIGDPYGPHLGWLGSYLATESQQKMKRDISRAEYERLAKSLDHIGFLKSSYEQFQRLGSVEKVWHFFARVAVANLFWTGLGYAVAGWTGVEAWLAGVFFYSFIVRDFNFRGHGGFVGEINPGVPLNQLFYGLLAGEWHENHHAYPRAAKSGFSWWQVDIPYWIIKAMALCGVVVHYTPAPNLEATSAKVREPELT